MAKPAPDLFDDLAEQFMANRGNRAQLAGLFRDGVHGTIQDAAVRINALAEKLGDAIDSAQGKEISFLAQSVIQLSARMERLENK